MKKINNYILEENDNIEVNIEVFHNVLKKIFFETIKEFKNNSPKESLSLSSFIALIEESLEDEEEIEDYEKDIKDKKEKDKYSNYYKSNHKCAYLRYNFGSGENAKSNLEKLFKNIKLDFNIKNKQENEVLNIIKSSKLFNEIPKIIDYKIFNLASENGGASGKFMSWKLCFNKNINGKPYNFYITNIGETKKGGVSINKIKELFPESKSSDGSKLLIPSNLKLADGNTIKYKEKILSKINFPIKNDTSDFLIELLNNIISFENKNSNNIFNNINKLNELKKGNISKEISEIKIPLSTKARELFNKIDFSDLDINNIRKDYGEVCDGLLILSGFNKLKLNGELYFPHESNNPVSDFDIKIGEETMNFSAKAISGGGRPSAKDIGRNTYNSYKSHKIEKDNLSQEDFKQLKSKEHSKTYDFYVNVISTFSKDGKTDCIKQQSKLIKNFLSESNKSIKDEFNKVLGKNIIYQNIINNVKGEGYKEKPIEEIIGVNYSFDDIKDFGEKCKILNNKTKIIESFIDKNVFDNWNNLEDKIKKNIVKKNYGFFYHTLYYKIIEFINKYYTEDKDIITEMIKNYKEFYQIYFDIKEEYMYFYIVSSHQYPWRFTMGGAYSTNLRNNSLSIEIKK